MKKVMSAGIGVILAVICTILSPSILSYAQPQQARDGPPPVGQVLVREGTFAVELAKSFGLGGDVNEATAESWLAEKGIVPVNGWIADYPVTPDIIGELRKSAGDAGAGGKINVNSAEVLDRFDRTLAALGLSVTPIDVSRNGQVVEYNDEIIPPADIYDYYIDEGPPVVTYYAPPPDYYGMYSWISYPFWCGGFWYGGYFILNDFHRPVFVGRDHHREFVSNHLRDRNLNGDRSPGGHHRFTRIDPVTRGVGVGTTGNGITGNRRISPSGVNPVHTYAPPAIRSVPVNSTTGVTRSISTSQLPPAANGLPGGRSNLRSGGRVEYSHTGSNVAPSGMIYNQSVPVRRTATSVATYAPPHTSAPVGSYAAPVSSNAGSGRSFTSGFQGGSRSFGASSGSTVGHSAGFGAGNGGGFSGGHGGGFNGGGHGRR